MSPPCVSPRPSRTLVQSTARWDPRLPKHPSSHWYVSPVPKTLLPWAWCSLLNKQGMTRYQAAEVVFKPIFLFSPIRSILQSAEDTEVRGQLPALLGHSSTWSVIKILLVSWWEEMHPKWPHASEEPIKSSPRLDGAFAQSFPTKKTQKTTEKRQNLKKKALKIKASQRKPQIFSGLYYRLSMVIINGETRVHSYNFSMSKPWILSRRLSLQWAGTAWMSQGFTAARAVPGSNQPPQNHRCRRRTSDSRSQLTLMTKHRAALEWWGKAPEHSSDHHHPQPESSAKTLKLPIGEEAQRDLMGGRGGRREIPQNSTRGLRDGGKIRI